MSALRIAIAFAALIAPMVGAQTTQRSQRGDTIVIRTAGLGAWGATRTVTEIGRYEGIDTENTFGYLDAITALPGGGVAVFDVKGTKGPALLVFDSTGGFVRQLGREGEGPGEYRGCQNCLSVRSDGALILLDQASRRVAAFDLAGRVLSTTPLKGTVGFGRQPQLFPGPDRSYFLIEEIAPHPRKPITDDEDDARYGFVRIDERGTIRDTIRPPKSWVTTTARSFYEPRTLWRPLEDGHIAVGGTDRLSILVRSIRASASPLLIEGPSRRIPFSAEEREEYRAVAAYSNRYLRRQSASQALLPDNLPTMKPAYRGIETDVGGRLLLRLSVAATKAPPQMLPPQTAVRQEGGTPTPPKPQRTWLEPLAYAVFERDGRYLGEVHFPANVSRVSIVGSTAWALAKNADGLDELVKYRLPGR